MTTRFLLRLCGILLLLILGAIAVQQQQMNRRTRDFRAEFLRHAPIGENGALAEVSLSGEKEALGLWEGQELIRALDEVQLVRFRSGMGSERQDYPYFQIITGNSWGQSESIQLSTAADRGWVCFLFKPGENHNGWPLSPQSCRALKSRIWKHYGTRLKDLEAETQ